MLAYVKKIHRHSDELLHLALILSLIRVDPESYLGLGLGRSSLTRGNYNITMGDTWAHTSSDFHHGFTSSLPDIPYLHPKSMEASLTQYQEELIEDLNDLGRYTNILPHPGRRTITAYLLNDGSLGHGPSNSNSNNVGPVVAASSSSMLGTENLHSPQPEDHVNSVPPQLPEELRTTSVDASELSLEVTKDLNQAPKHSTSLLT